MPRAKKPFSMEEIIKTANEIMALIKLPYHNQKHLEQIDRDIIFLVNEERKHGRRITEEDLFNLRVAGRLHEVGIYRGKGKPAERRGHAERSSKMARGILTEKGFNRARVDKICTLIEATSPTFKPKTLSADMRHLTDIILDADYANFGKDPKTFGSNTKKVREEELYFNEIYGSKTSYEEFLARVIGIAGKPFRTASAKKLWGPQRNRNARDLKRKAGPNYAKRTRKVRAEKPRTPKRTYRPRG